MKYLMVTNFDAHWDKIKDNRTAYTLGMIKCDISNSPIENADTIFIKKHKYTKKFEKCWKGKVFQFVRSEDNKPKIYFKVQIDNVIECPQQFINYPEGWYDISSREIQIRQEIKIITAEDIRKLTIPQVFHALSISAWAILIGIILFVAGGSYRIGYRVGTGVPSNVLLKEKTAFIKNDMQSEVNRIIDAHNENMKKLYESIVQEEHLAGSAKDAFEEGRHIKAITRIKTLLEKEKEDLRGRVNDLKQIKNSN